MMKATVCSIKRSKREGYMRITLSVDGNYGAVRKNYEVSCEDWQNIGQPGEGSIILDEEISVISRIANEKAAFERALKIVAMGDNSIKGLIKKLRERGFSRECAEYAAGEMLRLGYIDEDSQLDRLTEYYVNEKRMGRRKLIPTLYSKGYTFDKIGDAISRAVDNGKIDFDHAKETLLSENSHLDFDGRKRLLYKHGF